MAQFSNDCDDYTMFKKLQTVFHSLGASMVLDMSAFNAISLELAYLEFKERYVNVNADRIQAYLSAKNQAAQETTDAEQ